MDGDELARRCQLAAVIPESDLVPLNEGIVVGQEPKPRASAPRWSGVTIRTTPQGGGGGAGVREPRRPSPPPRELHAGRDDEPEALPHA